MVTIATADQAWDERLAAQAAQLFIDAVSGGAALGWVDPPSVLEVTTLLTDLRAAPEGESCIALAVSDGDLVGLGYWRRYARPTHRPHVDIERLTVAPAFRGQGIGRAMLGQLLESARDAAVEQVTLDVRGDHEPALALYRSMGFVEYGRLTDFVAFGDRRYDKVAMVVRLISPPGPAH